MTETVRAWLAERTYSDDEQNLVILVYATPDGSKYMRKERALTSFEDDREVQAAIDVPETKLATVENEAVREELSNGVESTMAEYGPDETI